MVHESPGSTGQGGGVIRALLRWLPLSLVLHVLALAAVVVVLPRAVALAPLFVDLTLSGPAPAPPPTGAEAPAPGPGNERAPAAPLAGGPSAPAPPMRIATPARPAAEPSATRTPPVSPPAPAPSVAPPPATEPAPAGPAPVVDPGPEPPDRAVAPAPEAPPVTLAPPDWSPPVTGGSAGESVPSTPAAGGDTDGGDGGLAAADAGVSRGVGPGGRGPAAEVGSLSGGGGDGLSGGGGDGTLALAVPGDGAGVYASYLALLRRRVQEAMSYPASARRRGLSGTVHLEIALEPTGIISDVTLARSSSHDVLDEAAVDAVRSLRRVPFPSDVRPRALRVRLPVVFELR